MYLPCLTDVIKNYKFNHQTNFINIAVLSTSVYFLFHFKYADGMASTPERSFAKDRHIQKIPHAKLVTPGTETEPTPVFIENMTDLPEPRIIGGVPAEISEFPFLVDIVYQKRHWCGGSYINSRWILTAAHCLLDPAKHSRILKAADYSARMGVNTLDTSSAWERRAITLVPHRNFHLHNNSYDIGLMQVDRQFEISPTIAMIPLPNNFETYEDVNATVIGWGITQQEYMNNPSRHSNQLLKVDVPVIAQDYCREIYSIPKYVALFDGHKVLCAGHMEGGKDACQGDSGGPLVYKGMQIGIVSWGIGCGNEMPGVYTNVYYYKEWIEAVISEYGQVT